MLRIYENFLLSKNNLTDAQNLSQPKSEGAKRTVDQITYKLENVIKFVDQLYDLGVLCYNEHASGYTAHGKAWVKAKVHAYLRRQAE